MKKIILSIIVVTLIFTFFSSAPSLVTIHGKAMGTTYTVKLKIAKKKLKTARQNIKRELNDINNKMSTYLNSSELSKFNQHHSKTPFAISPKTMVVIQQAQKISELSDGAFDISVGPLVNLWGFGPNKNTNTPSRQQIDLILNKIGYKRLQVSPQQHTIQKLHPELYLDLSAIAKGFAVDKVCQVLNEMKISDYMVEVGGEIRVRGYKGKNSKWRLGIESPQRNIQRIIQLKDLAIATSGDYRNFRMDPKTKKRLSHTIHPKTGAPIDHKLASVSVVAKECMYADAMATAMMVLGEEEGYELAEKMNLACYFIIREKDQFQTKQTPQFTKLFGQ